MAIGQDKLLVTPLQMATVAQTIGNGGVRMEPRLVEQGRRPRRAHGRRSRCRKEAERVMSSKRRRRADRDDEAASSSEGTGTAAALSGVEVAGKTGTAEIDPAAGINDLWFIGFTPKDAVAVVIERARAARAGPSRRPIAKQVLEALGG